MDKKTNTEYAPESVGSKMSVKVPVCGPDDTYAQIIKNISDDDWDSIRNVYVVNGAGKLLGYIDMTDAKPDYNLTAQGMMETGSSILHPDNDQEKAVFMAVRDNMAVLPVTDKNGHFLGAITARTVVSIMHEEHLEDALLSAGIREEGSDIVKLASARAGMIFKRRAPWLVAGLFIGLSLGLIASLFEGILNESIALAFFIPVVAYIAGSVGAQSSTITVRALATIKLRYGRYLVKELLIGFLLGMLIGVLGGVGALLIIGQVKIAMVVGLALFAASSVAALLSVSIPFLFNALGKDPALGSGPIVTAFLDVISIVIYFLIALVIM